MRVRHIVICGLLHSTIFFHMFSWTARFSGGGVTEHKMCVLIFFTAFVWNISHSKKKWASYKKKRYVGLHVESTLYSCPILMKLEFSRQIFEKYSNIKFHENPSIWDLRCSILRDRRTDGRTDMTKLVVPFRNFANAPKTKCMQFKEPVYGIARTGIWEMLQSLLQ